MFTMFVTSSLLALLWLSTCVHGSALPGIAFQTEPAQLALGQHFLAKEIRYDTGPKGTCIDSQAAEVMQDFATARTIMQDAVEILVARDFNSGSMLENFVPPAIRNDPGQVTDIAQGYHGYAQYLSNQPADPVIMLTCNAASADCTDPVNGQAVSAYWDPRNLHLNLCTGYWKTPRYTGDLPCTTDGDLRIYDSRARLLIHELMHNAAFLYIGGKVDYAREFGGTYGPWCCKQLANSGLAVKYSNSNADNYAWLAVGLHYLKLCKNLGNPPTIPVESDRGDKKCPFQQ